MEHKIFKRKLLLKNILFSQRTFTLKKKERIFSILLLLCENVLLISYENKQHFLLLL